MNPSSGMRRLLANADALAALAVVAVVVMMIIPLPPALLDVLLVFNISFTLLILLVSMYVKEPLELSIFPSLLLVVTLFRLALNVSGTRLILLDGYAGDVIDAFGNFVVGGSYVVGAVVFVILVVIQFIVLTNGAGRVAEVAARFTLDAMPGKQMSIDADLNSGLIGEAEARRRRKEIEREADFFGSMDGASKFVRGDAIAAVVIILVNILGGMTVGMWQKGMSLEEALQTFTLLTVGEGLVTQIPALLVSTATGLLVTRSGSEASLGEDFTRQLLAWPRALMACGGVLLVLMAAPGLPKVPFLLLAIAAFMAAHATSSTTRSAAGLSDGAPDSREDETRDLESALDVDPLAIEIGQGLVSLVDPRRGGGLLERITRLRLHAAQDIGIVVPPVRMRDRLELRPEEYLVKLFGVEMGRGRWPEGKLLAISPSENAPPLPGGEPTRDPAFGLPAVWIDPEAQEAAVTAGYNVVDAVSGIGTHLFEIIQDHAHELLGRQETRHLLDRIREKRPVLVDDLVPAQLGLGEIQKVLQNLLAERVSIWNLVVILETLANRSTSPEARDPAALTEYVRQALSRSICSRLAGGGKELRILTLSPRVEQLLGEALRRSQADLYTGLEPRALRALYQSLGERVDGMAREGSPPVVLCSPGVRAPFKRLSDRSVPGVTVLSYAEIPPDFRVEMVGVVDLARDGETPIPALAATA